MFEVLKYFNGQVSFSELMEMDKSMYRLMIKTMNIKKQKNREILEDLKKDKQIFSNVIKYTVSLDD